MSKPSIDPGIITVLATLGMVFGIIGMLISFIPCFGTYALFICVPASLVSGVATLLAYQNSFGKGFPIAALTISTIGLVISYHQYAAISEALHQLNNGIRNSNLKR